MSLSSIQVLVSKSHSLLKGNRDRGATADPRTGAGIIQDEPAAFDRVRK